MSPCGLIEISAPSAGAGELLFPLHDELRRAGIVAQPVAAAPPAGTKSSFGTVSSLIVSGLVSAATLRTLSQVLLAVVRRTEKRRIEIRSGDEIFILDAASARDGHDALEAWLRRTAPADEIDEA